MTSSKSNDNNSFRFDSILREIWQPDLIAIPIPESRFGSNTSVQIGVYITNNTRISFRFNPAETLIPELQTSDGQVLPRLFVTNEPAARVETNTLDAPTLGFNQLRSLISKLTSLFKPSKNYWLVKAGDTRSININTRLFWQNNLLVLEFHPAHLRFLSDNIYWFFDALHPGNYQLQIIYLRSRGTMTDSSTREVRTTQEIKSGQIATPFVNLYLVQPVGTNSNAVEVDGIRFETVVPEQFLTVPEKKRGAETPVQMGMSITNNTQTSFRFDFFSTLIPELVGANGQALQRGYFCDGLQAATESDYPLVMPGECVTRFRDAKLFWFKLNLLRLQITAGDGGFWIFDNFQLGVYQVRFVYRKHNSLATRNDRKKTRTKSLNWKWNSMVSTPFVELCLISSNN